MGDGGCDSKSWWKGGKVWAQLREIFFEGGGVLFEESAVRRRVRRIYA